MPNVSVVVPVLNAARTLPACLGALARLEPAPMEILLVDNGSADNSLSLLRTFQRDHPVWHVQVLEEPRRGAAAARNTGIRSAMGDVVAFTDADCAPEPAWLRYLTEPFADPSIGGVAGRVVAAPASSTLELFSALYTLQLPDEPACHERWTPREGGYPTANLAVRRVLLEELRGFDEGLMISGEDYDLCARLYAQGGKIAYTPKAKVHHHHRTTLVGMVRQAFGIGLGHPHLLRRHTSGGLWVDLPVYPLSWGKSPVRAWIDLASADKKVLTILVMGMIHSPIFFLLPLYALWLVMSASRRARQTGAPVPLLGAAELAACLLLKSAALTTGRWWGSVKYGALCL